MRDNWACYECIHSSLHCPSEKSNYSDYCSDKEYDCWAEDYLEWAEMHGVKDGWIEMSHKKFRDRGVWGRDSNCLDVDVEEDEIEDDEDFEEDEK